MELYIDATRHALNSCKQLVNERISKNEKMNELAISD